MELLKEILGEELYKQFETALSTYNEKEENKDKQVKLADLGTGEYVSKSKYADLEAEVSNLKEQIKTNEGTIKKLKEGTKDNEGLQETIKKHEGTIETLKTDYEGKIKELTISQAIQSKLAGTGAKYPDLISSKFDKGKLTLSEDGTKVFGIDEQLTEIKEQYKDLFKPDVSGQEPFNNSKPKSGDKNPWSKEHFNLTEQGRILKENPELAKQMQASI